MFFISLSWEILRCQLPQLIIPHRVTNVRSRLENGKDHSTLFSITTNACEQYRWIDETRPHAQPNTYAGWSLPRSSR